MKINSVIATTSMLLIVMAGALVLSPGLKMPYVDKNTDTYFSESITRASVAYGVCRMINASVSMIKESQVQIEPAGLGVSIAAGQVLDPLDDMTERASDILVTAIISLGIQKIAYELCVSFAPGLVGLSILFWVGIFFIKGDRARRFRAMAAKFIILLIVARICLPAASIINGYLQEHYFFPQITSTKDALAMSSPELERLKDIGMPQTDGVLGTVTNGFNFVTEKTADLGAALKALVGNMGSMVSNLLKLSYLYGAIFIVQVIVLPVGTFWLLVRIANSLFAAGMPYILSRSDLKDWTRRPQV